MSNPITTIDASPVSGSVPAGQDETALRDGWRSGGLAALRGELDRIDDAMHDLLMRRASVVEHVARAGKPAAFRPGREAAIIRRLLSRHQGALPPVSLVRIWRELLAGTTSMQGGFSLAVGDVEPGGAVTQLARAHFGALTPLRAYGSGEQAMADVAQGGASVAVLPFPSDRQQWWVSLMHHTPRLHVIGLLPFWKPRREAASATQALVVALTPPDASGDDASFLGLECGPEMSHARLSGVLSQAGLRPGLMVLPHRQDTSSVPVLVQVAGYLTDDDARLNKLDLVARRPVVLGSYAEPIVGAV